MEDNFYNLFRSSILKIKGKRHTKINNSLGVYDAYKYIRKNKWFNIGRPLTEKEFYSIIRTVNKYLIDSLLEGYSIKLPMSMGSLEIRKYIPFVGIKDNKLKETYPIDWNRTIKLWYENEEAYKNKTLVKVQNKEVFKIFYNRKSAKYNNKSFYELIPSRGVKDKLKEIIRDKGFDAFYLKGEQ